MVVSLCAGRQDKKFSGAPLGVILGAAINVVGYSFGRALIYSTPEYAMLKLPFQIFQAVFGDAMALLLCYKCGLLSFWKKFTK